MNTSTYRRTFRASCLLLLVAATACSDDPHPTPLPLAPVASVAGAPERCNTVTGSALAVCSGNDLQANRAPTSGISASLAGAAGALRIAVVDEGGANMVLSRINAGGRLGSVVHLPASAIAAGALRDQAFDVLLYGRIYNPSQITPAMRAELDTALADGLTVITEWMSSTSFFTTIGPEEPYYVTPMTTGSLFGFFEGQVDHGTPGWAENTVYTSDAADPLMAAMPATFTAENLEFCHRVVNPDPRLKVVATLRDVRGPSVPAILYGPVGSGAVVMFMCDWGDNGYHTPGSAVIDRWLENALGVRGVPANQPPTVSAGGPYTVAEGSPVTVVATGSDPDGDALTYTWDTDGDGAFDDAVVQAINATFPDNGSFTLNVRVTDTQGATGDAAATVVVTNEAPTVDAGEARTGNPGVPVTLSVQVDDAGTLDAPWTYTIDWKDGTTTSESFTSLGDGAEISVPHTFASRGDYQVVVTVTDKDQAITVGTAMITVSNRPPTAFAGGDYTGTEGAAITLTGTGSDPDGDDLTYAWDLDGDGDSDAESASASFPYPDDGTYTATLTVTDDAGAAATATATVTVTNVAPTGSFAHNGPVDEGSDIVLSITGATDASPTDVAAGLKFAFGCGQGTGAPGSSASARCATTDDGARDVAGSVHDKDGASSDYTARVTIRNVAPSVDAGAGGTIVSGQSFTLAGGFADPGADNPWATVIDWGDGRSTPGSASAPGAVGGSQRYLATGSYTVRLSVTDKDQAADSDQVTVTVERLSVSLDVKPGNTQNNVNAKQKGVLPVAILTTSAFDAALVDASSVRLGPDQAPEAHGRGHMEDVDGDGDLDMMLHFDVPAIGLGAGTTSLSLTADLTDGRQVRASDAVSVK